MKSRLFWLDALKIIGMLGVISIHIIGNTLNTFNLSAHPATVYDVLCKSCYFTLPLFVMISGALLLNKDINYKDVFIKYIKKMAIILLIFGSAFAFMEEFYINKTINFRLIINIIKRILTNGLWDHMWYIYDDSIISYYTIITKIYKKFQFKRKCCFIISFIYIYYFS